MTTLSLWLLYGGVFVVGGLGFVGALILASQQPETTFSEERPSSAEDAVDPIRSVSF